MQAVLFDFSKAANSNRTSTTVPVIPPDDISYTPSTLLLLDSISTLNCSSNSILSRSHAFKAISKADCDDIILGLSDALTLDL